MSESLNCNLASILSNYIYILMIATILCEVVWNASRNKFILIEQCQSHIAFMPKIENIKLLHSFARIHSTCTTVRKHGSGPKIAIIFESLGSLFCLDHGWTKWICTPYHAHIRRTLFEATTLHSHDPTYYRIPFISYRLKRCKSRVIIITLNW